MPEMKGTDFLNQVRKQYPETIRMMLTAHTDIAIAVEAINNGAIFQFINKPWVNHDFRCMVKQAFEQYDENWKQTHYSKAFNNSFEAILVVEKAGRVRSVNNAFSLITGFAEQEIIARELPLFKNDGKLVGHEFFVEKLATIDNWSGQIELLCNSGQESFVWLAVTVVKNSMNEITDYIYTFIDS